METEERGDEVEEFDAEDGAEGVEVEGERRAGCLGTGGFRVTSSA